MNEKDMIVLSIIVPVYNGANFVSKLLKSIYEQNHRTKYSFEVILVNDGSKDDSEIVCKKMCELYSNVRYVKKENGGIVSARNEGLKNATGTYITFADQDDIVIDGYDAYIQHCLDQNLDILVTSPYYDKNGLRTLQKNVNKRILDRQMLLSVAAKLISNKYLSNNDSPSIPPSVWNVIYKKKMIDEHCLKFKSFIDYEDDWLFNIETIICASKMEILNNGYYCWNIRTGSESHSAKYIENLVDRRKNWMLWLDETLNHLNIEKKRMDEFKRRVLIPRSIMMCVKNSCWNPSMNKQNICSEIDYVIGQRGWNIKTVNLLQVDEMTVKDKILLFVLKYFGSRCAYFVNVKILKLRYH